ncbi:hypothetical protein IW138_001964 [Coemansia sp. RSA 986]|nr:hypothetical protein IW138_001964 [Coemansia sp. RSA 986]
MKDHNAFEHTWKAKIAGHKNSNTEEKIDRRFLDKYLEAMRPVEETSLLRINSHGILAGVTANDMFEAGRAVQFRPGAARTINHFLNASSTIDCTVCIVSINWSESFIRGALSANGVDLSNANARPVDIHCNNMLFDAKTGLSTGHLPSKMVVASDKTDAIDAAKRDITERHGRNPILVYAGDSLTDLPALLDASIGLLFGDSSGPVTWCEWLGIRFGEQRSEPECTKVLYKLEGWDKAIAIIQKHINEVE